MDDEKKDEEQVEPVEGVPDFFEPKTNPLEPVS